MQSKVSFNVNINYGRTDESTPDAFETYLNAPPLPNEHDPIGYWSRQRTAAEATNNADGIALAQMSLDYLSAPATSVDPERLFSFSGGTISKLRNQLSDTSARATVLVGQWSTDPALIAQEEFEKSLVDGWSRKKKRKAPDMEVDDDKRPRTVIDVDNNSSMDVTQNNDNEMHRFHVKSKTRELLAYKRVLVTREYLTSTRLLILVECKFRVAGAGDYSYL